MAKRSQVRGLMCSTSINNITRFYDRDVSAALNIRRCALRAQVKMLGGAGVPTPKRVDSVEVHNAGSAPITVTVVFDNHKDKIELSECHEVPAGGKYHFTEKTLDFGSWQ
ncbi:uncharacterized protein HaLaN_19496, partial [Haematococcus lacustris]